MVGTFRPSLHSSTRWAALLLASALGSCHQVPDDTSATIPLTQVRSWAYQIQGLTEPGAIDALASSRYDLLVIEPTRTDVSSPETRSFDTAAAVARLKASPAGDGRHRKLVLAYIDIGQAESWRWYWSWSKDWPPGTPRPSDWPSWILSPDPDGWSGNFVVAFWDPEWQRIVIHGRETSPGSERDFESVLDEVIRDGFDGVYLDWVAAYDDEAVRAAAARDGIDPARAMADFVAAIRAYGEARRPGFLVIQQNAASLIEDAPRIAGLVDAIAQEETWYGGEADCAWDDPAGYDRRQDPEVTAELLRLLDLYRAAGKPVLTVDYALEHADEVYAAAAARGFIPCCSRTALDRLSTTPPSAGRRR